MSSKGKIVSIALSAMLLTNITTLANPINNSKEVCNNISSSSSYVKNREEAEKQIEMLDSKIEITMRDIEKNKLELQNVNGSIKKTQIDMDKTQKDIQKVDDLFRKRVRAMYISGVDGYLGILADSEGVSDFFYRLDMTARVMSFDKKVVRDLGDKKNKLQNDKKFLKEKSDKIASIKKQNEQRLENINIAKEKQIQLVSEIQKQNELTITAMNSTKEKIITARSIPSEKNNAPKERPSRGGSYSSSNFEVLSYAYKFIGVPYVWGGTSPSGFDCSGFTQYVYASVGVQIGRSTYDQIQDGVPVSRENLRPGDLVLFGSWDNPHHVGMYIGNNSYIHAPRTGDVIKVSPMTREDFVTGRRVR